MLEPLTIKPAPITQDDAWWYRPLFKVCFAKEDPWLESLDNPRYQGFHLDKKAFIFSLTVATSVELLTIGVDPTHRRKGLAEKLLNWMIHHKPNANSIFLEVETTNHAAIGLYKKLGFKEISIRKGYYSQNSDTNLDAVVMTICNYDFAPNA